MKRATWAITVKEYDRLCCNPAFAKSDQIRYLPADAFAELKQFVQTYEQQAGGADVLDFLHLGYSRTCGEIISFSSFVGLIQTPGGVQVTILPKIDFTDGAVDATQTIFLRMLRALRNFPGKVLDTADLMARRMTLFECFIRMYLDAAARLVKRGLRSDYVRQEENLRFFQGKLLVPQHIRANAVHRERFFVAHDEFSVNRPENRLIKTTLALLHSASRDETNRKDAQRLLAMMEHVELSTNIVRDFAQVHIDRSMKDYRALLAWSRVFLHGESFTSFAGDTSGLVLLFPMETVFEDYVAREIQRTFDPAWQITAQDTGHHLFDTPRRFALRPDIVIEAQEGTVILDTKWKRLSTDSANNYNIKQSDMYQMFAYAMKYQTPRIFLLYPLTQDIKRAGGMDGITFQSQIAGDVVADVRVFFVDLADMEQSLTALAAQVRICLLS